MDTLDQGEINGNQELVSQKALKNMGDAAPWMILMGVFFVLLTLFMLLAGVGIIASAKVYSSIGMSGAMQFMGAYYLLSGGVFGYGGVLCIISGTKASSFAKYPSSILLEEYTAKQKVFWILMGVNGIVAILFAIIFIAMAGKLASLATNL